MSNYKALKLKNCLKEIRSYFPPTFFVSKITKLLWVFTFSSHPQCTHRYHYVVDIQIVSWYYSHRTRRITRRPIKMRMIRHMSREWKATTKQTWQKDCMRRSGGTTHANTERLTGVTFTFTTSISKYLWTDILYLNIWEHWICLGDSSIVHSSAW